MKSLSVFHSHHRLFVCLYSMMFIILYIATHARFYETDHIINDNINTVSYMRVEDYDDDDNDVCVVVVSWMYICFKRVLKFNADELNEPNLMIIMTTTITSGAATKITTSRCWWLRRQRFKAQSENLDDAWHKASQDKLQRLGNEHNWPRARSLIPLRAHLN